MGLKRIKCKSREEWLSNRGMGIGASESAAIIGQSPWMTAQDLWNLKVGNTQPQDLSQNEAVQTGVRLESALREVFKAAHPEFKVSYEPFDMWYQAERPWMYATLDGRIKTEDGKNAILEIKTGTPSGKLGWDKWNGQIPQNYYVQCCHQMACLDYDFVIVFACLFNQEHDFVCREYRLEKADMQADIEYLIGKEKTFWQSVQQKVIPPMVMII